MENIRNFAIIAHIDHGKSTLADRLMELTGTVAHRDMMEQTLDSHPISRERGITIKLAPVKMAYSEDGKEYILNLIDTPGHVDFSYEVERSLAACEGAILLVDATQGIQAQTLSHFQKAVRLGLKIIPVINKIDSPNAKVVQTKDELVKLLQSNDLTTGAKISEISARTGEGIEEILHRVVSEIPSPKGRVDLPTRALIFSSLFDQKRGVVAFVRVVDGVIAGNEEVFLLASRARGMILEMGIFTPAMKAKSELSAGEVGYVVTNIKESGLVNVGDTLTIVTDSKKELAQALPGYKEPMPVVFVSFFPVDQNDFPLLEDGLKKLKLNDAAITFSPIFSKALGRGFRCGFLGHLHAEVSQERLEKDFDLSIIATMPTVEFRSSNGSKGNLVYEEPWVEAAIIVPQTFLGSVITICEERRGKLLTMDYHGENVTVVYELPLAEIVSDFFDQLKSQTSGFASMDYEVKDFRPFDWVQLEILINHEAIDAFSQIMERTRAERFGKFVVERLKEIIPRQQIAIPIQASVDGKIIAREDIANFRKDVTAKLYGGDVTRRMKLLEKQKEGKKKMKSIGRVEIPNDTFLKIFKT